MVGDAQGLPAEDATNDPALRDFVMLLTPDFHINQRVDQQAFIAFARSVDNATKTYFKQSPSERGLDLQVACALLPEDKLLLEIQVQPEDVPTETIAGLRRSLEMLPRPRVRFGPVAFSSRSMVRGGCTQPGGGFGFPFASLLKPGKQGMLDD